jgi:hypothetical protein
MTTATSTSTLFRRSVAVLATAGATVSLALLPAGGAHAVVKGMYAAGANADAQFVGSGGGSCDVVVPGSDDPISPIHQFSHGTRHASVDLDATFVNSLDSTDSVRVKGHADTSLTLHRTHGDLTSFALGVGGNLSVQHSVAGSECQASGSVLGEMQVFFSEHKKGYLYVTRDTKKADSVSEFILVNAETDKLVTLDVYAGDQSHDTSRALLKPGKYEIIETEAGLSIGGSGILLRSAPREAKAKATVHLSGEFKPSKKH